MTTSVVYSSVGGGFASLPSISGRGQRLYNSNSNNKNRYGEYRVSEWRQRNSYIDNNAVRFGKENIGSTTRRRRSGLSKNDPTAGRSMATTPAPTIASVSSPSPALLVRRQESRGRGHSFSSLRGNVNDAGDDEEEELLEADVQTENDDDHQIQIEEDILLSNVMSTPGFSTRRGRQRDTGAMGGLRHDQESSPGDSAVEEFAYSSYTYRQVRPKVFLTATSPASNVDRVPHQYEGLQRHPNTPLLRSSTRRQLGGLYGNPYHKEKIPTPEKINLKILYDPNDRVYGALEGAAGGEYTALGLSPIEAVRSALLKGMQNGFRGKLIRQGSLPQHAKPEVARILPHPPSTPNSLQLLKDLGRRSNFEHSLAFEFGKETTELRQHKKPLLLNQRGSKSAGGGGGGSKSAAGLYAAIPLVPTIGEKALKEALDNSRRPTSRVSAPASRIRKKAKSPPLSEISINWKNIGSSSATRKVNQENSDNGAVKSSDAADTVVEEKGKIEPPNSRSVSPTKKVVFQDEVNYRPDGEEIVKGKSLKETEKVSVEIGETAKDGEDSGTAETASTTKIVTITVPSETVDENVTPRSTGGLSEDERTEPTDKNKDDQEKQLHIDTDAINETSKEEMP